MASLSGSGRACFPSPAGVLNLRPSQSRIRFCSTPMRSCLFRVPTNLVLPPLTRTDVRTPRTRLEAACLGFRPLRDTICVQGICCDCHRNPSALRLSQPPSGLLRTHTRRFVSSFSHVQGSFLFRGFSLATAFYASSAQVPSLPLLDPSCCPSLRTTAPDETTSTSRSCSATRLVLSLWCYPPDQPFPSAGSLAPPGSLRPRPRLNQINDLFLSFAHDLSPPKRFGLQRIFSRVVAFAYKDLLPDESF
jgi:hypothetical protein